MGLFERPFEYRDRKGLLQLLGYFLAASNSQFISLQSSDALQVLITISEQTQQQGVNPDVFDLDIVAKEIEIIKNELHCNAIRISGLILKEFQWLLK